MPEPLITMAQCAASPPEYEGEITIEWPPSPLDRALTTIRRADTGELVYSVVKMLVHFTSAHLMWAELAMFADEGGRPIYAGKPVMRDGEPLLGAFAFLIREMQVRDAGSLPEYVRCGECAALVQPGDMPAHARWHDGFADRVRKIILDEGRRSMTGLRIPRTGIGDGI